MYIRALLLLALIACIPGAQAQTNDTLIFGNTASENNHSLTTYFSPATDITTTYWQNNTPAPSDPSTTPPSDVVAGGLGLSARRLLPRTPNGDAYGGQLTFTMAVDPAKQNYFTVKMWGDDPGDGFLILNCNGKEIGNRHGGGGLNEDPLFFQGTGWYANRFFYRTEPLPLAMTHGRNVVTITIRSLGSMYDYAPNFTYVPQYQHIMSAPSLGVYTAYSHAGPIPDVTGEPQGTAPTVPTPRALEDETAALANVKNNVNSSFAGKLNAAGASLSTGDASYLAQCYDARTNAGASWITYPAGKGDANVGSQIVAAIDALVTKYGTDPTAATNGWGGALGDLGDAVRLSWPLISGSMSATVAYGGAVGTVTRQAGLSSALRASVDAGRYNRRTIANQDLTCSWTIYRANRALLLVDSANALNESEAVRYSKEAAGIQPWLGNDQTGGGPTPIKGTAPYGPNWYMCTGKGTTKDGEGFVGSDYGEQGPFIYHLGLLSGDAQIQARGLLMTRARCQFRYPGVDDKGYLTMMGTDPIGVRNNDLPSHYAYLGRGFSDDFLMASQGAGVIGNDLLGYFQQAMNDGQMVRNFSNDPYLPGRWAAIKAMAQTNVKLPTTSGQPDYAWADEENMVVAAKHGEERFYANLFWRQPTFINGLAKVFHLTPTTAHLADVMVDDVRFRPTGATVLTGTAVDTFTAPPDKPVEAYSGLNAPIAWRSDLTSVPTTNRDAGRGTGYTFRYGNWLVGINADQSATYAMQMPSDFTSATDLISGQTMSGQVTLAPKTSAVFYLPTNVDANPPPSRGLLLNAAGGNGSVKLGWYAAGAATSYNVLRATTGGGPYAPVASGVTALGYSDGTVSNGTTYYYVLQSVNAAGVASGYSPEASATPIAPQTAGLAAPWDDADLGTSTGGSAAVSAGTFTLKSGPGDLYGTADGCHFAYQALAGDGVVTARLTGQSSTNNPAKSGLMIRGSLAAGSVQASISVEPAKRAEFDCRTSTNGGASAQAGASGLTPPAWVRLVRAGGTVTGYVSSDGAAWTQIGACTFSSGMPYVAFVGLVTSPANGAAGQTNTATFDNVSFPDGATAAPAAPSGLMVSAGLTSASLNWTVTPGAASYNVKRAGSSGGPFSTVATGIALNGFTDSGLGNGTYYYVVSAVNAVGESANSAAASVALLPPPAALAGLSVSASGTQSALSWTASPGASGYTVSRATSYAGPYTVVATGVTGTGYTDTGLSATTLYYYKVTPGSGNGAGTGAIVSSLGTGVPAPWRTLDIGSNIPGGASATSGAFTLYGNGASGHGTPFRYVYQTLTGDGAVTVRLTSLTNTADARAGLMIRDSLDPDSRYVFLNLHATSSGNNLNLEYRQTKGAGAAWGNEYTSVQPVWLRLVRYGASTVLYSSADGLAWTQFGSLNFSLNPTVCVGMAASSGDAGLIGTAGFDNAAVTASVVGGGTATANSDDGNGRVAAQAFDGNISTKWNEPQTPTGFLQYQFAGGASQVVSQYQLVCSEDANRPSRDPAAWQFQGSNDGTAWTTLDTRTGQVFANTYQANVYNIANTTAYRYYRLNITANRGGSGYGIQLTELGLYAANAGTTLVPPATPLDLSATWSNGQIALNWQATFMAASYNVKRGTATGGPYATVATGLTSPTYNDTSVTNGTPYFYVVSAINTGGESPNSAENSATAYAPPAPPSGLAVSPGNAQATLTWNAVANANSYNISRSTTPGSGYTPIGVSSSATYLDSGLTNGVTYYYQVTAVNLAAESSSSNVASATPGVGSIASSNGTGSAGEQAAQAFDGNTGSKWCVSQSAAWLQNQLSTAQVVTGYIVTSANDVPGRDPKDWQFQGSNDGTTWVTLDTESGQTFANRYQSNVYAAANATAYNRYRINITANAGGASYGLQLSELAFQTALPSPWSTADIGTTGALGGAAGLGSSFAAIGAGADIWGTSDAFRYVYQTATGDCSIVARVTALSNTNAWAKAGVMIRESTGAGSIHALLAVTPASGAALQYRTSTGGNSSNVSLNGPIAPYWVRLVRAGNVFTASTSPDGTTWTTVGSATITMASTTLIGLPVCSHVAGTPANAAFDNLTVIP